MRTLTTFLIIFIINISYVYAGENMYGLTKVDFFNEELPQETSMNSFEAKEIDAEPEISSDLWTEPVVGPGGNIVYYTPPAAVKDFLNNPTEQSAEKYLEWNTARLQKILTAQQVLRDIAFRKGLVANNQQIARSNTVSKVSPEVRSKWRQGKEYVAFFLLKGCPYCEQQKPVIEAIQNQRPDLHIEVFTKGYDQQEMNRLPFKAQADTGVSKSLGFNTYPTTLVVSKEGKMTLLRGVAGQNIINNLLKGKS